MNRLDEKRAIEFTLRELVLLNRCISHRGGTHPADEPQFKDLANDVSWRIIEAVAGKPAPTCTADEAIARPTSATCEGRPA